MIKLTKEFELKDIEKIEQMISDANQLSSKIHNLKEDVQLLTKTVWSERNSSERLRFEIESIKEEISASTNIRVIAILCLYTVTKTIFDYLFF